MNIVSNSLFHFTDGIDSIKSILINGFKMHYCAEEIYISVNKNNKIGIPMLCFCDIPLQFLPQNRYGDYALGMNKTWAWNIVNFQPVFYYPNNSRCQSTKTVIKASKSFINNDSDEGSFSILGVAKPYHRIDRSTGKICNYIDREWRITSTPKDWIKESEDTFNICSEKNPQQREFGDYILFDIKYVDFIIVKQKDNHAIIDFIWNELSKSCGVILSEEMKLQLISKIIIKEQLINNL